MEFKLNKNYRLEDIAIKYAKQNNISTMITYYVHRCGEDMIVEKASFFLYENLEKLCYEIIQECNSILHCETFKTFEIPDYLTNDQIKIELGLKALYVCNIPTDKININENDEKICSVIKECLELCDNEVKENKKYISDEKLRHVISEKLNIVK